MMMKNVVIEKINQTLYANEFDRLGMDRLN